MFRSAMGGHERLYKTYRKCLMCNIFCNHSFLIESYPYGSPRRYWSVKLENSLHFFLVIEIKKPVILKRVMSFNLNIITEIK